jgi:hypothetical protein
VDTSYSDIQLESFKIFSSVEPLVPEPKSNDEVTLSSKLHKAGFIRDMEEKEKPKGF